ncbi:ubiquitin-conjugating enzyme/RWD-like protein [Mariannaea sp. PMI_226]|nr:ubiquitin-conjugating enzyme/RWD-like protein [Mariannaea sp. PMI_226]
MSSLKTETLPSLRRQQLLSEFAGLKQACPEGVFVSLTPGDPTLWTGVIFVRKGPYSPAVLRFQMSFPDTYPSFPPLVTFSTDLFHPLLTPLTTYMYSADIQDSDTVSASDQEILPPGGFSLRHGFPHWFGRGRQVNRQSTSQQSTVSAPGQGVGSNLSTPASKASSGLDVPTYAQASKNGVSTYEILRYIRSVFDDEEVLDSVPAGAAGNPGAWHAWRTHRRSTGKLQEGTIIENSPKTDIDDMRSSESASDTGRKSQQSGVRPPSEWDWDGVWEDRVKKGIAASLSEPVLYGAANTPDDLLCFLPMEDNDIESVQENIRRALGNAA